MMTFEDIVDMDWLDSHSIKGEPMDLFPNDYVDFNHYLSTDLLSPKLEHASSPPPLLMASSPPSSMMTTPATSCSAAAALAAATTTPPPPLTFPTTEQIKQLIELAKHQLALRAAQTSANSNTNSNNSNKADAASSSSSLDESNKPQTPSTDSAVASSDSSSSPSTSHLAAHLADTNLFANNTNLPDTVSPESLMKPAAEQQLQTMSSKSTLIKSELDGVNSPSSLDKNVSTPMDTTEESSSSSLGSSSTKTKKTSSSLSPSGSTSNGRRDSLLGDDIGSLEAYAESDGIDIKKLTPKERRQLRNKISARNFRVRRKEYITTLEQQVSDHKKHAEGLAERLGMMENENKQLRQEVDTLKRQNLLLQQQQILQPQAC